jgi:peroxiredoxin Q/BCP
MAIVIGEKVQDFVLASDGGEEFKISDLKGKYIILYFYPKDNTSGCTKQACAFRDNSKKLEELNAVVVGVSPDSVKSHDGFKSKHELNFKLLSDTEKTVCEMFGVWKEKSMYGKKYMGVERSTFIISPDGILLAEFRKVKVDGHIDAMIKVIEEFKAAE